jgi:hypothetical protein
MTPVRSNAQPHQPHLHVVRQSDGVCDSAWPTALRALLLLTDAVHPADPTLARLSDEDLALVRAVLARLNGGEPTNIA